MNRVIAINKATDKKLFYLYNNIKNVTKALGCAEELERALVEDAMKYTLPGFITCANGLEVVWVHIAILEHQLMNLEYQQQALEHSVKSALVELFK